METNTNTRRRRWLIGGIVAAVAAALYFNEKKEKKTKKGRSKGLNGIKYFNLSPLKLRAGDYFDMSNAGKYADADIEVLEKRPDGSKWLEVAFSDGYHIIGHLEDLPKKLQKEIKEFIKNQ